MSNILNIDAIVKQYVATGNEYLGIEVSDSYMSVSIDVDDNPLIEKWMQFPSNKEGFIPVEDIQLVAMAIAYGHSDQIDQIVSDVCHSGEEFGGGFSGARINKNRYDAEEMKVLFIAAEKIREKIQEDEE